MVLSGVYKESYLDDVNRTVACRKFKLSIQLLVVVMGNCQAVDAAALVIQHPCGKIERMYWSVGASEIMKLNPGHYVSLIIPLPDQDSTTTTTTSVRFTRVKLLRPTDTLLLGHAYRLVTSQEVMKVLRAKKYAKMNNVVESDHQKQSSKCKKVELRTSEKDEPRQVSRHERQRHRSGSTNTAAATRSKSWRPSLQSISEAAT